MVTCHKDDSGSCCGLCHFKPVIVIATDNRIEITTKNISLLKKYSVVVVASDKKEMAHYSWLGVTVVYANNYPLGAKWQAGVIAAQKLGANPVIILGSDDFLSDTYIKDTLHLLNKGYSFVGMTKWFSYDAVKNVMYKTEYTNFNKSFPIGSGRAYSKTLLDQCGWKIFDKKKQRLLDDYGYAIARQYGKIHLLDTPEVLAVKGRWECLNPMHKYLTSKNIIATKADLSILKKFKYE